MKHSINLVDIYFIEIIGMISGHKIDDKLIYTGHITSPHNIITRTTEKHMDPMLKRINAMNTINRRRNTKVMFPRFNTIVQFV